jgi:hypothetical protein
MILPPPTQTPERGARATLTAHPAYLKLAHPATGHFNRRNDDPC